MHHNFKIWDFIINNTFSLGSKSPSPLPPFFSWQTDIYPSKLILYTVLVMNLYTWIGFYIYITFNYPNVNIAILLYVLFFAQYLVFVLYLLSFIPSGCAEPRSYYPIFPFLVFCVYESGGREPCSLQTTEVEFRHMITAGPITDFPLNDLWLLGKSNILSLG